MKLDATLSVSLGLQRESVIKTTKIYTGSKTKLGNKIADLPQEKKEELINKYREYQNGIVSKFYSEEEVY